MESTPIVSESQVHAEIETMRIDTLIALAQVLVVLPWVWIGLLLAEEWAPWSNALPAFWVMGVAALTMAQARQRPRLIGWLLACSLSVALVAITRMHPTLVTLMFTPLAVIVAYLALGDGRSLLLTVVHTVLCLLAYARGLGVSVSEGDWVAVALMQALTWVLMWLTGRPRRITVEWALTGWERARDALLETRQRRGELYGVVRSLDEATYRIERMNNELILARSEAEVARAIKARFAATVSHELRGPLNLISGFGELMVLSPERYGQDLTPTFYADSDAIYRNAKHLEALVDDVLDLSQLEAQQLPLVKDHIDLVEDVLTKAVETVRPLAERKGLRVDTDFSAGLPWVLADPVRLRQVLMNLLHNAIRHCEAGSITILCREADEHLRVAVRDTGEGIAEEDLPRLFREFQQVSGSAGGRQGGSGLGLSISKHLVELHGGQIWIESTLGVGTTVQFTVPLPGRAPESADPEANQSRHTTVGVPHCLLVHDAPAVARTLDRHTPGYRIVGVPTAEDAAQMVEQLHPRALVTSPLQVDVLNQRLAAGRQQVPVISCGLPEASEDGLLHRSVRGYLLKPFTRAAVRAMIQKLEIAGGTTILLVDDDPDVVRLLESMLTALPHPYTFLRAYDGRQALEVMRRTRPDVVFLDWMMPEMTGDEALAEMARQPELAEVPVVIVSGQDPPDAEVVIRAPLVLHTRQALDPVAAGQCLQALMDLLGPSYLPEPEHLARPLAGPGN